MSEFVKIKSISELHKFLGIGKPKHPAITVIDSSAINRPSQIYGKKYILDFYMIALKNHNGEALYGRNYYDFQEGALVFMSPNQVITPTKAPTEISEDGWSIYFHPDFVLQSDLGKKIHQYSFFSYAANESLHLSEDEKETLFDCVQKIKKEYSQNIDKHSQSLMISNLELLLNYCTRFYDRQFYTRSNHHQDVVSKVETFLLQYFNSDNSLNLGLPTVRQCAEQVNLSPNYLSDLLKKETGKNTKEHIDYYVLKQAKSLLLTTNRSVSEIAYDLGFEYSQSFSKFFKKEVGSTPNAFRRLN